MCYKLVMPVMDFGLYIGGYPTTIEANGQPLDVTVHFARVGGRMTCVGLDIRSFRSFGSNPPEGMSRLLPVRMNLTEITSPLLRAVPTATVIEKASADFRSGILGALDRQVGDLNGMGVLGALAGAGRPQVNAILDGPSARRRGPKPQLDDTALRDVVARAYLDAPSKRVQAVQEALRTSELTKGIFMGHESREQASKAVVAARCRHFIPPAKRGGKQGEEQS